MTPSQNKLSILGLAGVLSGLAVDAWAQGDCAPIRFAPGRNSATVQGTAPPEETVCHSFTAAAGQRATLKVTSGRNVIFAVEDVVDGQNTFGFTTLAKTYRVRVGQMFRSVTFERFKLSVSVTGAGSASVSAAPSGQSSTEVVRRAYAELSAGRIPPDTLLNFSPGLYAAVRKERRCEQRIGDGRYANAIWFSGNDYEIHGVAISERGQGDSERQVTVGFKNMQYAQTRTFVLKRIGPDWRIDNVFADGRNLQLAMRKGC